MFGKSQSLLKNLSPSRKEALKPPFSRESWEAGGLGLSGFDVNTNTFQVYP